MADWISVKDRLPEHGVVVLINVKNKPNLENKYCVDMAARGRTDWGYGWYTGREFDGSHCYKMVTHWMPLPKAVG